MKTKMTMRNLVLRAVLKFIGAVTANMALYLDHPSGEMPVWFVMSCVMGSIAFLCALFSFRETMLRGMAASAAIIAALAMILAILIRPEYTDPAPKIGGIVYLSGVLIMGALPWLIERMLGQQLRATPN